MNDELNIRNIDSSCSNISSNQDLLISVSELVHVVLSDVLRNITMKDGDFVGLKLLDEVVGFGFHLGEDDRALVGVVFLDKVLHSSVSLASLYEEGVVIDSLRSSNVLVLDHVHSFHVLVEVLLCDFVDPSGNSGGKHDVLGLLLGRLAHMPEDFLDIVFESFLEHRVSLIDANDLNTLQVECFSFKQINQSAWRGNNDSDSSVDFIDLPINRRATVN